MSRYLHLLSFGARQMDLGAKYRSPRQPHDDIRLQKTAQVNLLKTAQSQAGPYIGLFSVVTGPAHLIQRAF